MKTTLDLLTLGEATAPSRSALAKELRLSRNALKQARDRGRLSPVIAGKLAKRLNLPVLEWMAIAALESEPDMEGTDDIKRLISKVRNSYFAKLFKSRGVRARPVATGGHAAAYNATQRSAKLLNARRLRLGSNHAR